MPPGETPDDPDRPDVANALRVLMAQTHGVEDALARRLGIGVSDVIALQHLVDHADAGPVDLGNLLRIRSASATVLVDRLQSAGHVRRDRHPTDGRRVVLALTDTARADAGAALAPMLRALGAVVADFTPDEQRSITRFLRRATEAMADFAAEPTEPPAP